jgi:hypothetical protein
MSTLASTTSRPAAAAEPAVAAIPAATPKATKSRLFLRVSSAIWYLLYFMLFIHLRIGPVTLVSAVSGDITSEMWL